MPLMKRGECRQNQRDCQYSVEHWTGHPISLTPCFLPSLPPSNRYQFGLDVAENLLSAGHLSQCHLESRVSFINGPKDRDFIMYL